MTARKLNTPRVLVNLATMRRGGAVTQAAAFMPELVQLRPDIEFTAFVPLEHADTVSGWGVEVVTHQFAAGNPMLRLYVDQWRVRRLAKRSAVVLSLLNHGPVRLSCSHILWSRNALYFEPGQPFSVRTNAWLAKRTMASADLVVFPSVTTRRAAEQQGFRGDALVLRHPYRPPAEPASTESASAGPGRDATSPLRIFVPTSGQAHKNLKLLPAVSARLQELGVDHVIDVTSDMDALAGQRQVRSVARYTADDLRTLQTSYDIVLLPSTCESFSYPLLEFEELGLPVAASNIGAHEELADSAWLFDPHDPVDAAEALLGAATGGAPTDRVVAGDSRFNSPATYAAKVADEIDHLIELQP